MHRAAYGWDGPGRLSYLDFPRCSIPLRTSVEVGQIHCDADTRLMALGLWL